MSQGKAERNVLMDELISEEIEIAKAIPGEHKAACPRCSHRRPGMRDMVVRINSAVTTAEAKCSNCLFTVTVGDKNAAEPQHVERTIPKEFVAPEGAAPERSEYPANVLKFFERHGIKEWAAKAAKVAFDSEIQALQFPYFEDAKLVNMHTVTFPEGKGSFQRGGKPVFYGIDATKPAQPIIIVDGELNQLALASLGVTNVIGVPKCAPASKNDEAFQFLAHAEELLKSSSKITLATPAGKDGDALRAELARRIGAAKCYIIELPQNVTDIAQLVATLGEDVALDVINSASAFPITGIYEVTDFEDTLLSYFEHGMSSGVSTGWENLDEFYTVMLGELDVVTGIPNMGKSEWLDALMVNLAVNHGWRFGIFSPENMKEGHTTKLIEKRTQQSIMPGHPNRMSRDTFLSGAQWVSNHFVFILGDDEQNLPTLEWLLDRARSAVLRYGIKGLVLDPWNEIEHTRPQGMSETDYISLALSKIKRFARNHEVKVWIVAHPQKMQVDPKTGLHRIPSLYDISGSAHWANKVDNGIVIHRDTSADDTTIVVLRKVRHKHVGRKGETRLVYQSGSGTFSPAPDATKGSTSSGYGEPLEGDSDLIIIDAP